MPSRPADAPRFPWWYRNPRRLDAITLLVAVVPAAVGAFVLILLHQQVLEAVPAVVTIAGALLSRRVPRTATLVVAAAPLLTYPLDIDPTLAWCLVVVSAPLLTMRGPSATLVMWTGAVSNAASVALNSLPGLELIPTSVSAILVVAATATAAATKRQISYLRAMEDRAIEAIAERDREAERRIVEERLRIARDLHDVVGHKVAIVSVQLSLAEVNVAKDPERATDALHEARGGIQAILHEMQRILEVLRFSDGEDAGRPTGGIAALPELIGSFRKVGMSIDARLAPVDEHVDALVDTAIYRVAQESLTNAQKHGDGSAQITLGLADGTIELRVSNGVARHSQESGSGFGLVGMRERVESTGGTLKITDDGDRFEVVARIRTTGEST